MINPSDDKNKNPIATPVVTTPEPEVHPELIGKGNEPTAVMDADGKLRGHVTRFGSYNRFTGVDGKVLWANSKGQLVEEPHSMRMAKAMNEGYSPIQGTANSWDDAITKYDKAQGNESPQSLALQQLQFNKYKFDSQSLAQRNKQEAQHKLAVADLPARALRQLNEGQGVIKEVTSGPNKGTFYRIVIFKDGDNAVNDLNGQLSKMGRKPRFNGVAAAIIVNKEGIPIKGAQPIIKVGYKPEGGVTSNSETVWKTIDSGRIIKQYADASMAVNGMSEEEAQNNAANYFGMNPLGWNVKSQSLAERKFAHEQEQAKAQLDLEREKLAQQNSQFDRNLEVELAKIDAAQKTALDKASQQFKSSRNSNEALELISKLLPKEVVTQYFSSNKPMIVNGEVVEDENGQPVMAPLAGKELEGRMIRFFNVIGGMTTAGASQLTPAQIAAQKLAEKNKNKEGKKGETTPTSTPTNVAKPETGVSQSGPTIKMNLGGKEENIPVLVPTLTEEENKLMREDIIPNGKGIPMSIMLKAVKYAQSGSIKKNDVSTAVPTPTTVPTSTEASPKKILENKQAKAEAERNRAIRGAGIDETIAEHYDSISPNIMSKLSEVIPNMTYKDIYAGKYNRQIYALAERWGDESTMNVIKQIGILRDKLLKDRIDEQDKKHKENIRSEAERIGTAKGWTQKQIDAYVSRRPTVFPIFM